MLEIILLGIGATGALFLLISLAFGKFLGDNGECMGTWRDTLKRLALRHDNLPSMTIADFHSDVGDGKKLSILADYVIDLSRLRSHPGGDFLHKFKGRDMTPWFLATHCKQQRPLRLFRSMVVGRLVDGDKRHPLLPDLDREYLHMFESYNEKGWFANRKEWVLWDFGEVLFGAGFGLYLLKCAGLPWLGYPLVLFAGVRQGWLMHDIGHRALHQDFDAMQRFIWYLGNVVYGVDMLNPLELHDQHHAFVNVIGLDSALQLGPIKMHRTTNDPKEKHMGILQNFFYYGFVMWMALPYYMIYEGLIVHFSPQDPWYYVKLARVALLFYDISLFGPLALGAVLWLVFFAVFATLNHFHMPMKESDEFLAGDDFSFVRSQVESIQNTNQSKFYDWAIDHFSLHIEHHLFPYMPRRMYNKISPHVQELCAKYEVPYNVCSAFEAFKRFNKKLMNPF